MTKPNPLAALHAARAAGEPTTADDKPLAEDDGPDPIQLAVVQGLAANPAMVMVSPEEFADRADSLIIALGVPASILNAPHRVSASEHVHRERNAQHVLTLLNEIQRGEHALRDGKHDAATCRVCAARKWLESQQ